MSDNRISWTWRHAIAQSKLPSTTKHVLLTISLYMNEMGQGAYPSQEALARATSLTERAIQTHIKKAVDAGWLTRREHGFRGQKWRNHEYRPKWPDIQAVDSALPDVEKGGERGSGPFVEGAERDSAKVANEVPTKVSNTNSKNPQPPNDGQEPVLQTLLDMWPDEQIGDMDRVKRGFDRLTPAQKRDATAAAQTFFKIRTARSFHEPGAVEETPTLRRFLDPDYFSQFVNTPPITRSGRFLITPDSKEEWAAWLKWAGTISAAAQWRLTDSGKLETKTRWPTTNS